MGISLPSNHCLVTFGPANSLVFLMTKMMNSTHQVFLEIVEDLKFVPQVGLRPSDHNAKICLCSPSL